MKKIGFVGLGIMGTPMAMNILKRGYPLMVYNRTKDRTIPLMKQGAEVASDLQGLASWADVIILMLTGPEAIEEVLRSERGILSGEVNGKVLINMSTISPSYAGHLKEMLEPYGVTFIDAPVSGSKRPAEEGTLVILAGGPEKVLRELEPLFLSMGKKVVHCGDVPMGSAMKMTVNLLLGVMMEALTEAVNLGQRCGLKVETILDTILSGPLSCGLFQLKEEMLKKGVYPSQFPLKHMLKDLRFILQTADEVGAPVPSGHTVFQLYRQASGMGLSYEDFASVKKAIERLNDRL